MTAKILIIDDNEPVAKYLSDLLMSHGFHTTIFTNSKEALDYCKANLHQYKLVISDICMPDMNGDELAKEILSLDSQIPIILCSGYVDHVSKQQLFNIGIKEFMDKPINSGKLLTIIGDLNLC